MSSSSIIPATNSTILPTPVSNTGSTNSSDTSTSSSSATSSANTTLASNFTEFLQLLTTQLQNQDPLDPLDTNQFTQQLVEFAQVEQQLKSNDQLSQLVSLQQTAQSTQALQFVGATVAVNGSTTQLTNGQAQWSFSVPKPATVTLSISNSAGQTVYTNTFTGQTGMQNFTWNGVDNNGIQWPDGTYTMTATATDASGQSVGVSTEVDGVVDSVDMTQSPPVLSVAGQNYTLDQIKRVMAPTSAFNAALNNVNSLVSNLTGSN